MVTDAWRLVSAAAWVRVRSRQAAPVASVRLNRKKLPGVARRRPSSLTTEASSLRHSFQIINTA